MKNETNMLMSHYQNAEKNCNIKTVNTFQNCVRSSNTPFGNKIKTTFTKKLKSD